MVNPLVSIVVLNWNGKRFIDQFMRSFLNQTYPRDRLELIFADNGSADDSVQYFKKHYGNDPRCRIILNGRNYGFAGGNNLGLQQASGDYVVICNNDLVLDPRAIEELVDAAEQKKADVVTAKLMYLNKHGYINNAGSRLDPNSDWPIYEIGINDKDGPKYQKDYPITAFCGACVLMRRDFLQTVGLFDKRFFLYFEDGDLSWRGQKAGKKYLFAHKAIAYHEHTGSTSEGSALFNHFVGRNRLLILTKNASLTVILKGWAKTLRDHLFLRVKRLYLAARGKYPKRLAVKELYYSCRMMGAALALTPYAIFKRFHLIREEHI